MLNRVFSMLVLLISFFSISTCLISTHNTSANPVKDYNIVNVEGFNKLLLAEDESGSTQYVRFHFDLNSEIRADDISVGKALDAFLVPRPWWRVVDLEQSKHVSLVRADARILPILQIISASQNPSDCSRVPLRLEVTAIDSYGNAAYNIQYNKEDLFWAIHGAYVPYGDGTSGFVNVQETCPELKQGNVFFCLFLSYTNCTTGLNPPQVDQMNPVNIILANTTASGKMISKTEAFDIIQKDDVINNMQKKQTLKNTGGALSYEYHYETFVTGKTLVESQTITTSALFVYSFLFRMNYLFRRHVATTLKKFYSHGSYHFKSNRNTKHTVHYNHHNRIRSDSMNDNVFNHMHTDSIDNIIQRASEFKPVADHKVHEFENAKFTPINNTFTSVPFPTDGDCVVIHIRRSYDRQIPGVDMNEWCRMFNNTPDYQLEREGKACHSYNFTSQTYFLHNCENFIDMGCDLAMPFGVISLQQYINASQILSNTTVNLYIRTDNPKWLYHKLEKLDDYYKKRYNFFIFTTHENHRNVPSIHTETHFTHNPEAVVNDVKHAASYFAAIEIARKCNRGFVGHSGSAVTGFWLNNLCAYHAGVFGKCPPFFDFAITSGPKSWDFRQN